MINSLYFVATMADTCAYHWLKENQGEIMEVLLRNFMAGYRLPEDVHTSSSYAVLRRCFIEHVLARPTIELGSGRGVSLQDMLFAVGGAAFSVTGVAYLQALKNSHLGLYRIFSCDDEDLCVLDEFGSEVGVQVVHGGALCRALPEGAYFGLRLVTVHNRLCAAPGVYPLTNQMCARVKTAVYDRLEGQDIRSKAGRRLLERYLIACAGLWLCLEDTETQDAA